MTKTVIAIEGMSCQHCVKRVEKALTGLEGVKDSTVEVGSAKVTFDETKVQQKEIEEAIIKAGYKIKN
jgi:copper ion binding protein